MLKNNLCKGTVVGESMAGFEEPKITMAEMKG